jgi:hypothetical protein
MTISRKELLDAIEENAKQITKLSKDKAYIIISDPKLLAVFSKNIEFNEKFKEAIEKLTTNNLLVTFKTKYKDHVLNGVKNPEHSLRIVDSNNCITIITSGKDNYLGYVKFMTPEQLDHESVNAFLSLAEDTLGIPIEEITHGTMRYIND